MRKKLFSILALLLTVCSAWAQSNTITVYFTDAQNWGNAYVYYWVGESFTDWPGMEMTFVETNNYGQAVYKASIPSDATGILFHNNDENQTLDITQGIEDGAWWYTTGEKDGNLFIVVLKKDTYIVAGTPAEIFGTAWDASNKDNLMTKGDDGIYRKEYTVDEAYDNVQLKVVRNGEDWIGDNGNNVQFKLTGAGTFTVVFDPDEEVISVTGDIVEVITQLDIDNVYAVGNGEGNWLNDFSWDPANAANEMTEVADDVWQITFNDVSEGFGRQVKFTINGTWTHNFGGTFEDSGVWSDADYNGDNITFDTYDICTVTLTLDLNDFDINTKEGAKFKINIVYPTDPTDPTDISFATVTGINASYDWTGNEIHPVPVVTLDGNVLSSDTDYDVTYSDGCTNVGSYNVTITGKNDYTGTIEKSFNINDVFYLVGSMNNWEINQNYKLVKNEAAETEEYFIKIVQFASDDEFKVASPGRKTEWDGATWYPEGMENNYVISNAGIYDIYFRPNGDGGSDWHEGYIYAAESVGGFDVALAPTGYGTFYCEDYEATLPSGVVAYIVTDATPTYEVIADGDGETKTIPAGTAVLLYSASKPSNVTLSLDLTGSTTDDRTFTNLLDGSDVETQTDTDAAKYYKLTYGNDNTTFGWYWGAANGAAFTSPAHKAWLALPASAGARAFFNLPGEENTTGIPTIENKQQNADNVWYDLNGCRINAPKTKGIYVKDGRKLVIK